MSILEAGVDTKRYKERLLALQNDLLRRASEETALGRDQVADSSRDAGDASVANEAASEDFAEAQLDSMTLQQVRDALRRIEEGTFGRCIVDDGPIEPKRLEAVPWTQYCLKHQTLVEAAATQTRMPTL
jgi:DnaK suppressor protein